MLIIDIGAFTGVFGFIPYFVSKLYNINNKKTLHSESRNTEGGQKRYSCLL